MILVLASSFDEYKHFVRYRSKAEQDQFRYVNDHDKLRGYRHDTRFTVLAGFFRNSDSRKALELLDAARALGYVEVSPGQAAEIAFSGRKLQS